MGMFQVDEALINANAALANTNNPDDQNKILNLYNLFKKGKISKSEFNIGVQQAAKAQGKTDAVVERLLLKQGGTPTAEPVPQQLAVGTAEYAVPQQLAVGTAEYANPGNGIDAQGKSEIPNSSAVSDANAAKTQANAYTKLKNNVQYVINTLKTYRYPQRVLDSFQQDIDKILANTKDNNRIVTANQYIDQFLGDKQDLRRQNPAPNQQPQKVDAKAAGGTQGVQGVQAGAKTGNAVVVGGTQGSNNGSGKKPRMSDAEANAFLKEELGIDTTDNGDTTGNGTYASAGVAKGGTKTVGYDPYDPNPGNVSLAYAMRNAPEQERKAALIDEWNKEHGISYVTGKDGVIYRIDPQHPNGYVDPFKNDLSTWIRSTGYATGKGMLTSDSNGTYATGEGIETPMPADASSKFRIAWKDPMSLIAYFDRGAFTDDEYNQLVNHAVNDLGFNKELFSRGRYK